MALAVWILVALAVLALGFYWLSRGGGQRPLVVLRIQIPQSGTPRTTVDPPETLPGLLIQALVCYGAKVRWLLNSEPAEIVEVFRGLMGEALDTWDVSAPGVLDRMPAFGQRRMLLAGANMAVPGGEDFVVRFYRNRANDGYVLNDLPRGLSVNIAWHYFVLLDDVHKRLSPELRVTARRALADWWEGASSAHGEDSSVGGLQQLNRLANAAYHRAVSTPDVGSK